MSAIIERGDCYFFYRSRIDAEQVDGLDDVQRFHLVLAPDGSTRARLLLIGRKQLPTCSGEGSDRRNWAMVEAVDEAAAIGRALGPLVYETKTRGERHQQEAVPVAAGRYALAKQSDSTRLAYSLQQPEQAGHAQETFRIHSEASYVVSVRNPALEVPGFPDAEPDFPDELRQRFADERWLDVDDPRFLEHEQAQLLLIGAHTDLAEEGIEISGEADLFGRLALDEKRWPTGALTQHKLVAPQGRIDTQPAAGDRGKGGRRGGPAAAETASAAGIARALGGIDFPEGRQGLLEQAKENDAAPEIVAVLEEFPARTYHDMSEVQQALADIR